VIVISTEDSLQHLHEIHESIQQMRDQTMVQALSSQVSVGTEFGMSTHCHRLLHLWPIAHITPSIPSDIQ
jgi:hypothetical protein